MPILTVAALVCAAGASPALELRDDGKSVAVICDEHTARFDWPALRHIAQRQIGPMPKTGTLDGDLQALSYTQNTKWYAEALVAAHDAEK